MLIETPEIEADDRLRDDHINAEVNDRNFENDTGCVLEGEVLKNFIVGTLVLLAFAVYAYMKFMEY